MHQPVMVYLLLLGRRESGNTMSRYAKRIDDIRGGQIHSCEARNYGDQRQEGAHKRGPGGGLVLEAIRQAKPRDLYYVFMGFCLNADLAIQWTASGRVFVPSTYGNQREASAKPRTS